MSAMAQPLRSPLVLAAPDAFKGTAAAAEVAGAVAAAAVDAGWVCDECPLSDGGEGFATVISAAGTRPGGSGGPAHRAHGGHWVETAVTGPIGGRVVARWYLDGAQAVIESATASGLPLAGGAAGNDPVAATTRGTGELIVAAIGAGARRILVGVGGSATTDGGLGAVEAIDAAGGLQGVDVVVACDVQTLFVDAAEIFGPQKGATPDQVVVLRRRLEALAHRYGPSAGSRCPRWPVPVPPAGWREDWPSSAPDWCPDSTWWPTPSPWPIASAGPMWSSPVKVVSTRPRGQERSSGGWRRWPGSPVFRSWSWPVPSVRGDPGTTSTWWI